MSRHLAGVGRLAELRAQSDRLTREKDRLGHAMKGRLPRSISYQPQQLVPRGLVQVRQGGNKCGQRTGFGSIADHEFRPEPCEPDQNLRSIATRQFVRQACKTKSHYLSELLTVDVGPSQTGCKML